ncbi:MAG: GNAT family N-acetyltransferase [Actinomycetota bacterium]
MPSLPAVLPLRSGAELRRWQFGDRDALMSEVNENHEHLQPWMPWAAQPATVESITTFLDEAIAAFDADLDYAYGLFGDEDRVLGAGGVHRRDTAEVLEIGYWIAQAQSGRGLGREVGRALTVAASNAPGIVRVEIRCDEANVRSASIPRALGYELVEVYERPREAPAHTGRGMVWSIPAETGRTI